jgi:hypothetical protein
MGLSVAYVFDIEDYILTEIRYIAVCQYYTKYIKCDILTRELGNWLTQLFY